MNKFFLFITIALLFPLVEISAINPQQPLLKLQSGEFTPPANLQEFIRSFSPENEQMTQGFTYRIIQFNTIPTEDERVLLRQSGIELLDYLPDLAYFAAIGMDADPQVLAEVDARSVMVIEPQHKLEKRLHRGEYPGHAIRPGNRIALIVSCFRNTDIGRLLHIPAENCGGILLGSDEFTKTMEVEVPVDRIECLASLPFVMFIESIGEEPKPENYTGRTLHRNNTVNSDYASGRHYDGTGVNIMLQDDGVIGPHIDYQGRIGAQFLTNNNGDHGDHCAGIMVAGGNLDPRARGNAPGATLYVYSTNPSYPGFSAIPTVYNSLGIRITSTSYGDGCNAGYTTRARVLDQQVRIYPSLMHVFSAGNSGTENCNYGAGSGWGNITGGHKQGKNVFAVANLTYLDELVSSSSRGPAHDGRIKPDVASKGTDVYSTINPNTYQLNSGTSMACPGVAGTIAQLMHGFRELNNGSDPMAGLMKGILLNTAEDLGNPGPDYKFGWGRVNALRAIRLIEEGRYDSGIVSQGLAGTHLFTIPPNTAQVRLMVYWTDYEAAANAATALVNNLDMTVTDPSSNTWLPWVLNPFPHPDSLNKPAIRGVDNLNNMEQVTLNNPAAGQYIVNVMGTLVPQGPQNYHVICEVIPAAVTLTYPIGGESMVPGENEVIRWDASAGSTPFTLLFSPDNGAEWDTIANNVAAGSRAFTWAVPSIVTGQGIVKIVRGTLESSSDTSFSIIGVPCGLTVDWACDSSLHLSWSRVPGATGYTVFKLGEKNMDPVGFTTNDHFLIRNMNVQVNSWFSVRAEGPDGATGRRAMAIENTLGISGCVQRDLRISSAPIPQWGIFRNSMPTGALPVNATVWNYGLEPLSNPTFNYQLNNGTVVTEPTTLTIQPDSVVLFRFFNTISLSDTGTYLLKIWVQQPGDQNPANDSLLVPLRLIDGGLMLPGSLQTFDNWTKCLNVPICETYSCALADDWHNMENGTIDDHDWRTFSGSTSTSGTGPDFDHTTGTNAGKYLYLEPTMYCVNKMASLISPVIDLNSTNHPSVKLWYHAYGADIGSLHADLFDGTDIFMDITASVEGNQGNEWKELSIDLNPWKNKKVVIRLRGYTGCKDKGDLAIDDFRVADVMTGAEESTSQQQRLILFPNPTEGVFTVQLISQASTASGADLVVRDVYGRMVYRKNSCFTSSGTTESIDLRGVPAGIYMVELNTGNEIRTGKLVIR